jgi:hypothetical protein
MVDRFTGGAKFVCKKITSCGDFRQYHYVADSTQTIAASIQLLPDAIVKSVSTAHHGQISGETVRLTISLRQQFIFYF